MYDTILCSAKCYAITQMSLGRLSTKHFNFLNQLHNRFSKFSELWVTKSWLKSRFDQNNFTKLLASKSTFNQLLSTNWFCKVAWKSSTFCWEAALLLLCWSFKNFGPSTFRSASALFFASESCSASTSDEAFNDACWWWNDDKNEHNMMLKKKWWCW